MDIAQIIKSLETEISRLQQALDLLKGLDTVAKKRGRPKGSVNRSSSSSTPVKKSVKKKKRTLSAEARAKIAAAQKARWAKKSKTSATKPG